MSHGGAPKPSVGSSCSRTSPVPRSWIPRPATKVGSPGADHASRRHRREFDKLTDAGRPERMASTARRLATEHTRSLAADVFRYHEHALNAARLSPVALATVQADPLCTPQPNLLREQLARSRENPRRASPGKLALGISPSASSRVWRSSVSTFPFRRARSIPSEPLRAQARSSRLRSGARASGAGASASPRRGPRGSKPIDLDLEIPGAHATTTAARASRHAAPTGSRTAGRCNSMSRCTRDPAPPERDSRTSPRTIDTGTSATGVHHTCQSVVGNAQRILQDQWCSH